MPRRLVHRRSKPDADSGRWELTRIPCFAITVCNISYPRKRNLHPGRVFFPADLLIWLDTIGFRVLHRHS